MFIIFDIIIVGFIVISGFIGYKKGLSEIVINIIGLVLALVLAFMLKGTLAQFIDDKTNISSTIKETIVEGISTAVEDKVENITENLNNTENNTETTPEVTTDVNVDASEVTENPAELPEEEPEQIVEEEQKDNFYTSLVEKMGITDGIDMVAEKVVKFILETASFIIIFIVVSLTVFIVKMMLNLVFKLPVLSSINEIGGLIAGTLISVIQVWVVLAILSFLSPMLTGITDMINATYVTRALYNINLIVMLLSHGLKF